MKYSIVYISIPLNVLNADSNYNMAACKCFSKFIFVHDFFRLSALTMTVARRSMAGHSKWANIKFKKMHRDIARAKILGRLHKEIVAAVRGIDEK
jgi:DNA relaxase NicK